MKKTYVNATVEFVTFMTNDVVQASNGPVFDAENIGENGGSISMGDIGWI